MLKKPNNFDRRYVYKIQIINSRGEVKNKYYDYREVAELAYKHLIDDCVCGIDSETEFLRFIIEDIKDDKPNGDVIFEFASYSNSIYLSVYK